MTQKPSQTEDLTACTGYPAPTIKSWDAGIGLETKKECDILSAHSMSSQEEVDEWLRIILNSHPGDKMEGIDNIFGEYSRLHFACSNLFWCRLLGESALQTKYRSETNCTEIVRGD